jgi:hypothetical protein
MGGTFDWNKVCEADMRRLSERMFDAADVPADVRKVYWIEYAKMVASLQRQTGR